MKKHNKLVRDKIPEICQGNGDNPIYKVLRQSDFKKELKKKLVEESHELLESEDVLSLREEMADVYEVLLNISKSFKIKWSDVEKTRRIKNKKRGSFKKKYFLISTK
jgi:predicted house-cleaning noncanonical NTP pyrophosphatase (MazG superfamily)